MSEAARCPEEGPGPVAGLGAVGGAGRPLARVIRGSLLEGLEARLGDDVGVEDIRVGRFVVVEGERHRFFSAVHDVKLAHTNEDVLLRPPDDPFVHTVLRGTNTYATVELRPKLLLDEEGRVRPVKTIPPHFATVREALDEDVATVFGTEGGTSLAVGTPLEMTTPVCLDLERFVERSNAVFGKTGTGKSFLTRMLLAGVISSGLASVLVFDMHNEYGMWSEDEETKRKAPALKEMFGQRVLIFSVDPASSRRRKVTPDYEVQVSLGEIEVEDLALLRGELNLQDAQLRDMETLAERWGPESWLERLFALQDEGTLDDELERLPGVHAQSVKALGRNLRKVARLPFVRPAVVDHSADRMLEALLGGRHVVIEFGGRTDFLSYMLVSSIVTRRLHRRWKEEKEKASAEGRVGHVPQLVVTLEEAHKFLSPEASRQTIFGEIAREMRKYNVTLLVVDQRPSGIDSEIRSQLGTRIVGALDDERDQAAVLEGVPDARALRVLLANLEPKRQALLGGYAVPMPIVVEARDYYEFAKTTRGRAGRRRVEVDLWDR